MCYAKSVHVIKRCSRNVLICVIAQTHVMCNV